MSVYKNIASITSERDIEGVVYNLTNRFGPIPKELNNLLTESRLKLESARAGVSSIVRRACGLVITIGGGEFNALSFIEYSNVFFNDKMIKYHILPSVDSILSLCVHIKNHEYIYSIFSQFLSKFALIKK